MIIDGETYACEGCIRGHRTRSCQHSDRPLQLISKKGRPVSQCNHCRVQRKSRSAHVKCECGKRADGTGGCGCHQGGRCTCATKKSPKQQTPKMEDLPEFGATESLGPPAISDPTLSNPVQITSSSDLNWQDMASPMSGYSGYSGYSAYPIEGTGPDHSDQNAWQQGNEQMQQPSSVMNDQTFSGNFMAFGTDRDPNTHDLGINTAPYNDHLDAPLDLSYSMNDWPNVDSDATKEFLGMLDGSHADLGLNTNGWDFSNLLPGAGGHESSDMILGATNDASAGQQTNEKKCGGGGGQCCS